MPLQAVPLPPPFSGQFDRIPTFSVQNPFCIRARNWNNNNAKMGVRPGNKKHCTIATGLNMGLGALGSELFAFVATASPAGFAAWDITTTTPTLDHSVVGPGLDVIETLLFRDRLFVFGDGPLFPSASGPRVYDGSTWGSAAYTWPGSFRPYGGCVYKNRAYIMGSDASYVYTEIDAISGPTYQVDLSGVLSAKSTLSSIRAVSLSENVQQETLIAFIFASGEILVYGGSYPNSDTWGLSARFQVDPLIAWDMTYKSPVIDAKGDTFILTRNGILSLRNILRQGYQKERDEGIGSAIPNRWKELASGATGGFSYMIQGCYDSAKDRLVISWPKEVDPDSKVVTGRPMFLIYDFVNKAWYESYTAEGTLYNLGVIDFNGSVFTGHAVDGSTAGYLQLETKTDFRDDKFSSGTVAIAYDLISAPHPLSRFGVVKAAALEVITKSDLYSVTNFSLIGDLGARVTANQKTNGNGTNLTKTMVNVGLEANTIQYRVTGETVTATVGLEMYGTNLWVDPSNGVSR